MKDTNVMRSSWLDAYSVINKLGEANFAKVDKVIDAIELEFYIKKYCMF